MNITTYMTGGMALVIAVIWGWWTIDKRHDADRIQTATAMLDVAAQQIATAKAANESNLATLTAIQADLARQQAAATKFEALARDRAAALWQAKKRISDAPKSEDGPVSGVLLDTVDQLRMAPRSDTTTNGNNAGATPAPPGPAGPDVPAAPAAPTS